MSIKTKLSNKIKATSKQFNEDKKFSIYYAILRVLTEYTASFKLKKLSLYFKSKHENWLLNYLKNCINNVLTEFKTINTVGEKNNDSPIWISWWTGAETAPLLVKQCIKSIYKNANGHPVYFITRDNFNKFVEVPDYILKKADAGTMKLAHLCDYVRIALLEKYGGLWLDTTIFCSKAISDNFFDQPFFTCRSETQNDCPYISKMRWVTFVLGGYKNNVVFSYLKKAFETYWSTNESAVDYLFFDCLIELGYENVPVIKQLIDDVPINNLRRDDLQAAMNARLPANKFYSVVKPDTILYKLSWRENYSETTDDSKPSIYNYFLNL